MTFTIDVTELAIDVRGWGRKAPVSDSMRERARRILSVIENPEADAFRVPKAKRESLRLREREGRRLVAEWECDHGLDVAAEASAGSVPPPAADKDDAGEKSTGLLHCLFTDIAELTPAKADIRRAIPQRSEGGSTPVAVRGANIHPTATLPDGSTLTRTSEQDVLHKIGMLGMQSELYDAEPEFRDAVDDALSLGRSPLMFPLLARSKPTAAEILRRALLESMDKTTAYSTRAVVRRLLREVTGDG